MRFSASAFGGEWEDWCDTNYPSAENNAKCKNCNRQEIPLLGSRCTFPAPWTVIGKQVRGLPQQTDLQRGDAEGVPPGPLPEIPDVDTGSWLEDNKLLVGAGAVGLIALLALRRGGRRGFMGLGSSPKRRRKRRN